MQRVSRSMGGHSDTRLDALEDIRCDEMEREERREAREDQQRAEDRQERAEDRRAALVALSANAPPPPAQSPVAAATAGPADVTGLWLGQYGPDRFETVRVVQDGSEVVATKVTGDVNVPAGEVTFKATLVGDEGEGFGRAADSGYSNPRWVPGRLHVLSATQIAFTWQGVGTVRLRRIGP